jgi:hypothetical protein
MILRAGQPLKVGVSSMMAWPGWGDAIPVTMPKSTMEMVGISGSITVSRRALMELGMVGFLIYDFVNSKMV